MKVYVAYFIYKGVLGGLEVHTDLTVANARADEWRKQANPEEDVVDVLVEELRAPETEGTPLRELGLPKIFYRRLKSRGYETVEQLCQATEKHLSFDRLIGAKCISLVKEALAKRGLGLREL